MLITIAGATGNIGQCLIHSALSRGHTVRALARNPSKLPADIRDRLESFVELKRYDDVAALDEAVKGVNAVICAYAPVAELQLEGQLLLLRAAERAGVQRYVADSWNYDWRTLSLGDVECYDAFIAFRAHVAISSPIRPCYILTGMLTDVFFSGGFSPANGGIWDKQGRCFEIYGTGDELYQMTSYRDAAEFTVEIIQSDKAVQGGFFPVHSFDISMRDLASRYGAVRGEPVLIKTLGSADDLEKKLVKARAETDAQDYYRNIPALFQLSVLRGKWALKNLVVDNYPASCRQTLEQFLHDHPEY